MKVGESGMCSSDLFLRHLRTGSNILFPLIKSLLQYSSVCEKAFRHCVFFSTNQQSSLFNSKWLIKKIDNFIILRTIKRFLVCSSEWNYSLLRVYPKPVSLQSAVLCDGLKQLNFSQLHFALKNFEGKCDIYLLRSETFCPNLSVPIGELEITGHKIESTMNERENIDAFKDSQIFCGDPSGIVEPCLLVASISNKELEVEHEKADLQVGDGVETDYINVALGIAVCNISQDNETIKSNDACQMSVQEDCKDFTASDKVIDSSGSKEAKSIDGDSEVQRPCNEKLRQFKAKLAMNATVLPADLLEKTMNLVTRHPSCASSTAHESVPSEKESELIGEFSATLENEEDHKLKQNNEASKTISRKSKNCKEKTKETNDKDDVDRPKRNSPSHFVSIQVTNQEIHKKIGEIQEMAVKENSLLKNALVNLSKLHLTLMVMRLEDEEQMERAKVALDVSKERILALGFGDIWLSFSGVSDFGQKVVFAKVQEGRELDQLKEVVDIVRKSFVEQSLFSTDDREFAPHMTIMKLSRDPRLFSKIKRIDRNFYADMKDEVFGLQLIESLQLCAMKHAGTGYYPIEYEAVFIAGDKEAENGCTE